MKFQYGKQDWKTFERGEENCYLMTNGLGGFSSLSMIASCSRNDQAVLMACTHSPNHRYNMIHRLEEEIILGREGHSPAKRVFLSSQDFQRHEERENGYRLQTGFVYEDYPVWSYLTEGVEVVRTIALMQGRNTVGISYRIRNRSQSAVTLRVRPHLQFVPKGQRLSVNQKFECRISDTGKSGIEGVSSGMGKGGDLLWEGKIISNGQTLYLRTNGVCMEMPVLYHENLYYSDDVRDGKMALGRTAVNHEIYCNVEAGEDKMLEIVYGMEEKLVNMTEILQNISNHRKNLQERFHDETARALAAAADQFISHRDSTGEKTILAGFPFFEDWGRDTMIALVGCCLSTRQYDTAKSILRTFMAHCRRGLMPNLFPEGTEAAAYNTVDAALLFILAVYEYLRRTGDNVFIRQAYPVMRDIIRWYAEGTEYGIHMDQDGLIMAGQGYDQVTWMDVRVEDILPTPRHGKPVEINAYWYNALRIMEELSQANLSGANQPGANLPGANQPGANLLGAYMLQGGQAESEVPREESDYGAMADRVYVAFEPLYWNREKECLRDVISGTAADDQIRCNQIWAVSLPFSLLPREKEKQVVETVFRKLYTPVGLRTLNPEDSQFHPFYGGAQLDRDLAYHQGTVWTFPLGGYYLAYLKVNDYSRQAKAYVREQLKGIETALREGCVGQLPEIYDGGDPISSKGCFAQAWSVGEILRVYEVLEHV